jgi:hypothetical protein
MVTAMQEDAPTIIYEGPGEGTELLGALQANFYVPGLERDFAVFVNEPAIDFLREELGVEDTPETRQDITRRLGELIVARKIRHHLLDPITFAGKRVLDDDPSLLEDLKRG